MSGINPKEVHGSRKYRMTLVPQGVMAEVAVAMLHGASKYGAHNWRSVSVCASVYIDAAMRHLQKWWEGEDVDPEAGVSHLAMAISNLAIARDAQMRGVLHDDRPPPLPNGWYEDVDALVRRLMGAAAPEGADG